MGRWKGNGKKKKNGNRNSGMTCWYCKKKIRGKVKFWSSHAVHAGGCYSNCCKNLMTGKNLLKKVKKSQPKKGFLARIFGW